MANTDTLHIFLTFPSEIARPALILEVYIFMHLRLTIWFYLPGEKNSGDVTLTANDEQGACKYL